MNAVESDARARCAEILSSLVIAERCALKAISNGTPGAPLALLGKFKALGLIEHYGERILLTNDGWLVLRLCHYGAVTRPPSP
jgi:hypothetical protein